MEAVWLTSGRVFKQFMVKSTCKQRCQGGGGGGGKNRSGWLPFWASSGGLVWPLASTKHTWTAGLGCPHYQGSTRITESRAADY